MLFFFVLYSSKWQYLLIAQLLLQMAEVKATEASLRIGVAEHGSVDGHKVQLYSLHNNNGTCVKVVTCCSPFFLSFIPLH
jgi:hypothetical protein